MLKLYHCNDARSFRPLWALEELGLDYQLHMMPFPPRVHERSYLEVNPLGTIPALFDGAMRMTESAAICEYLAAKFGPGTLGVTVDEAGYGPYLNALHYGEATLTFPQTLVLRYTRLEPEERRNPQVAEDYGKWFIARLKGLDALLAQSEFVAADRFTALFNADHCSDAACPR
jgi:glutathione S-transferase